MKPEETIKSLIHRFEQCSQDGTGYFDAELSAEECDVVVAALSELSVIDQIRRQRDTAIRQLADLRYGRDGDAISRQTAIRAITSHDGVVDKSVAKRILTQLPSAQPERETGEWNFVGNQMHECTNCGVAYTEYQFEKMRVRYNDPKFPKFCPNCGADMRGESYGD